jgi:hypothetical protein
MNIYLDRRGQIVGDIAGEISRLKHILTDLQRYALGDLPTEGELRLAPLINGWCHISRPTPALIGVVTGHPICRGPITMTSDIWVMARHQGWMRTSSRLWRLGTPHIRDEQ